MNATVPEIFFYVFSLLIVFCAVRVVTVPHVFRAALYLASTLALLGVQYLMLQAEFVAIIQVLVYVGAVVILIIFAVMLTAQLGDSAIAQSNRLVFPGFIASAVFVGVLLPLLGTQAWDAVAPAKADPNVTLDAGSNIQSIGHSLLSTYVFPFELVSLVLLTALIGAVVIARKDPEA